MKIAVTATGTQLESVVDPRFGRARYILIVDPETMEFEAVDNSGNAAAFSGAGIGAAAMVSDRGAEVLLTGSCGPKAYLTLNAAGIKVVNDVNGTVMDAVKAYKKGGLSYAAGPNKESHW